MKELEMYQKMYAILCGAVSDSLELLDAAQVSEARSMLKTALEWA